MRLNEIQESFKDIILHPELIKNEAIKSVFRQGTGICLENRMKVYRNNVIRSLVGAVMAALPMTKKITGEKFLEQAARAYVAGNLPAEGNLNLYGASFSSFIASYEPAKTLPYLADFITLEWAWEAACHAPDDAALAPDALVGIPEKDLPRIVFHLRSSVSLIESDYPLDEIVDFCRSPGQNEMRALSDRGVKLMVIRPGLQTHMRKPGEGEYQFLKKLSEGKSIHQAAIQAVSDPHFDLTPVLQKHLILGSFSSFRIIK